MVLFCPAVFQIEEGISFPPSGEQTCWNPEIKDVVCSRQTEEVFFFIFSNCSRQLDWETELYLCLNLQSTWQKHLFGKWKEGLQPCWLCPIILINHFQSLIVFIMLFLSFNPGGAGHKTRLTLGSVGIIHYVETITPTCLRNVWTATTETSTSLSSLELIHYCPYFLCLNVRSPSTDLTGDAFKPWSLNDGEILSLQWCLFCIMSNVSRGSHLAHQEFVFLTFPLC